jgi:hypothetical protein
VREVTDVNVASREKSCTHGPGFILVRISLVGGRPERRPPRERLLKHHDKGIASLNHTPYKTSHTSKRTIPESLKPTHIYEPTPWLVTSQMPTSRMVRPFVYAGTSAKVRANTICSSNQVGRHGTGQLCCFFQYHPNMCNRARKCNKRLLKSVSRLAPKCG